MPWKRCENIGDHWVNEKRLRWWSLSRDEYRPVLPSKICGCISIQDFSRSWGWSKPLILGWNDVHSVVETCLQCVESAGCREGQRGVQRNSDQTAEVLWKSLCCLPYTSCNDPHLARASRSSKADSVPKLSYFRWQPLFRNWPGWSFCSLINKWLSGVGFDWALPRFWSRYPRYTSADGEIDMAPLGNRGDQPDGVRDLIDKKDGGLHIGFRKVIAAGVTYRSHKVNRNDTGNNWSIVQWCVSVSYGTMVSPGIRMLFHVIPVKRLAFCLRIRESGDDEQRAEEDVLWPNA